MSPRGIRRHGKGWETYARVGGKLHTKQWPLNAPREAMKTWVRGTSLQKRAEAVQREGEPSLAEDVKRYLETVAAMPTIAERTRHLGWWLATLGEERTRRSVTSHEVASALQGLLQAGYSAQTALHYRNVLRRFYAVIDEEYNPVAKVQRPTVPGPKPCALSYETVRLILDAMTPSKTRARLAVIAYTGLPHRSVMKLEPPDVDLEHGLLRMPLRRKGRGAPARIVPLLPLAMEAFREFSRLRAWGPFSPSAMHSAFGRVLKRLGLTNDGTPKGKPVATPYHLRHSFGTWMYRATGDRATVARLLGHASLGTTARYTLAAEGDVDRAAVDRLAEIMKSWQSVGTDVRTSSSRPFEV